MKIIYIMGEGRSGSTILDIALGSHPEIAGVGELAMFFENEERLTGVCSCGSAYRECEVWNRIHEEFRRRIGDISFDQLRQLRRRHDLARSFPARLLGFHGRQFREYCHVTKAIYESIAEVTQKDVIVDSTKQLGRALSLAHVPGLDVHFLHLVRDGRAVLWSRLRDRKREVNKAPSHRASTIYNAAAWSAKNTMGLLIRRRNPGNYLLVRYENLVREPAHVIPRIGELCGLSMEATLNQLASNEGFVPGHQIGGNMRARTSRPQVHLKYDDEWTRELSASQRAVFWLLSGWVAKPLGYTSTPLEIGS